MQDLQRQPVTIRCGGTASWLISTFIKRLVPRPCCHHGPPTLAREYDVRWGENWKCPNCSWKTVLLPTSSSSKPQDVFQHGYEQHLSLAVQDESCLWGSKKNSQGKKSDLETKRFVISCHTIWLSGKLPTLSIAKNQTTTLSSTISWCIKTKAWYNTTHI